MSVANRIAREKMANDATPLASLITAPYAYTEPISTSKLQLVLQILLSSVFHEDSDADRKRVPAGA